MYALVDCNSFYANCERVFRPDLKHRPVVVLSNNDGCVIARSAEAKQLGIPMGVPAWRIASLVRQGQVVVFSSNYPLYADMSARVMTTLEQLAPRIEVYSIDEAFLLLTGMAEEYLHSFAVQVRDRIDRYQGLPVCVGIAPSRTLAKLANHAAKQWPATDGVVVLTKKQRQRKLMSLLPVDAIWGVGKRQRQRLTSLGIESALDLADADPLWIQKRFSVVLARTVHELNGIACLPAEEIPQPRQQIICSRSFGQRIYQLDQIRQAVASHVSRAAERLRDQRMLAGQLSVFIQTGAFDKNGPGYANLASGSFEQPTVDTRCMTAMAWQLLERIWREGHAYAKAGVMLNELCAAQRHFQGDLFAVSHKNDPALMQVMDNINRRGKAKVWFASQGMNPDSAQWAMRQSFRSPAYTTRWSDLLPVNCDQGLTTAR